MTGTQYRKLRRSLKLNQSELAKRLDVDLNTISRRERDKHPISREAELAIKQIARSTRKELL